MVLADDTEAGAEVHEQLQPDTAPAPSPVLEKQPQVHHAQKAIEPASSHAPKVSKEPAFDSSPTVLAEDTEAGVEMHEDIQGDADEWNRARIACEQELRKPVNFGRIINQRGTAGRRFYRNKVRS